MSKLAAGIALELHMMIATILSPAGISLEVPADVVCVWRFVFRLRLAGLVLLALGL